MQLTPRKLLLSSVLLMLVAAPLGASAQVTVRARATAAIELPQAAIDLRAAGVPPEEVHVALVEVHRHEIPAPEVRLILHRSVRLVRVHPFPDYGAFIRVQLNDGIRGPALVEAIRVEHRRHVVAVEVAPPGHQVEFVPPGHRVGFVPPGHRGKFKHGHGRHGHGRVEVYGPAAEVRIHAPAPPRVEIHAPRPSGRVEVRAHGGGSVMVSARGMH